MDYFYLKFEYTIIHTTLFFVIFRKINKNKPFKKRPIVKNGKLLIYIK